MSSLVTQVSQNWSPCTRPHSSLASSRPRPSTTPPAPPTSPASVIAAQMARVRSGHSGYLSRVTCHSSVTCSASNDGYPKVCNHGEGPYYGLFLVESYYCFHI